ncbi:hypothetical protein KFZ70_10200 [Tamlana fucoidanivorans]|uniref:Peptide O-xylosyltransferase n=1 Tax=Allotamlana fucoidanivorans TaxID=2583814 RepID=A0A5C4SNL1_9FLAO|nr:beta-1,6-N-acetylglucosaminyltransferase [Tamlana fucoidanivorans]TNJ45765.1 hypothetical protein FGF67_05125 [Tamlana fucoidanivorans]
MKQAILITAYKNMHHLEELAAFFDDSFELYIHIDKKSGISKKELESLKKYDVVKLVSQKYKVNWGGFNHLKSILFLTEQALKNSKNFYLHLISGHDFPIKPKQFFLEFFKKKNTEFISYFEVPRIGWADNNGMDRLEYFNLYDVFDAKKSKHNKWIKRLISLQKKYGYKRSIPSSFPQLYGGATWWSLTRECAEYVIEYTNENKSFFNRFKHTLCSEEFYFQTIIMNSRFAENVSTNTLRYIDWNSRNGNRPAVLDELDYEKLTLTDAVFARKFEYPISEDIMKKLRALNVG